MIICTLFMTIVLPNCCQLLLRLKHINVEIEQTCLNFFIYRMSNASEIRPNFFIYRIENAFEIRTNFFIYRMSNASEIRPNFIIYRMLKCF